MHVAISATKVEREAVAISTTSTPCSATSPGPLHPLREVVLELLELLTGTSWASRMAGGRATQRRGGGGSQGPANPKKAQAKGKSRSPRGKGGGSAGGDHKGGGKRGRGSSGTPTPKPKEGYRSRQVSRQPKSPSSRCATPRLAEASCDPVGFRRRNEDTPVLDVDSSATTDYQQDDPPSDGPIYEDGVHVRDLEEVKPQQKSEEEEQDRDEKFRRLYLEQLKWSAAAFKEREIKENLRKGAPRGRDAPEPDEGDRGGGKGEGGRRGGEGERPFFPSWDGTHAPSNPQRYQRWSQVPDSTPTNPRATSAARASSASTATVVGPGSRASEGEGGGGGDRRAAGEGEEAKGADRVGDGGQRGGRGGGRGGRDEGGEGKGGGKVPIAKTLPKPRPAPIVTDATTPASAPKDATAAKRGSELGEPTDPIDAAPTEAATPPPPDKGRGAEEWVDSSELGHGGVLEEGLPDRAAGTAHIGRGNSGEGGRDHYREEECRLPPSFDESEETLKGKMRRRARTCSPRRWRRRRTQGQEVKKKGKQEEGSQTQTFPSAQGNMNGAAGKEEGEGVREPEVAWEEEGAFTGGLDAGEEEGKSEGGGAGALQEEDGGDGQGGNETPHAPTVAWSDPGAAMEEDDDEGGRGGEGGGGEGGDDIPPRPLPLGEEGGGGGGFDIPPRLLLPGEGRGGEGGIDIPPHLLPPRRGADGPGAGGRRLTTTDEDMTKNGPNGQLLQALRIEHHAPAPGPQLGLQELRGKDGITRQKKDDEDEVQMMFKQLLEGQVGQKKASEAAEKKIAKGLNDLRNEVHVKHEWTTARLDGVATTLSDFKEKMEAMGEKVNELESRRDAPNDSGDRGGGGGGGGGGLATGGRGGTTLSGPSARDQLKVAVGGWTTPQLKRVLEERARGLAQEWGEAEAHDVYSYKRAQVAYIIFKVQTDVISFLAKLRRARPTTGTGGDDYPIWANVSQPPEMRAKALPLRAAARAIYTWYEEHDAACPRDLLVDYHRNEIVIGNVVVMEAHGTERTWHRERWLRVTLHVPIDDVIKTCESFAAPPRQE